MCFLLGNDFLPHFPVLNLRNHGLERLMRIYKNVIAIKHNEYIIKPDMTIHWRNFKLLVSKLADHEHSFLLDEYKCRERYDKKLWKLDTQKERDYAFQSIPLIERTDEHYICPTEPFWERRYYKSLLYCDDDNHNIQKICNNFMEGIEWTLKYYCGECPNWKWCYNYHYPPLLTHLKLYLPDFSMDFIKHNSDSFSHHVQLAFVMPPRRWDLLPLNVRDYLMRNHINIFNHEISFKWAFCKYFWEAHVQCITITLEMLEVWDREFKTLR